MTLTRGQLSAMAHDAWAAYIRSTIRWADLSAAEQDAVFRKVTALLETDHTPNTSPTTPDEAFANIVHILKDLP